MRIPVLGSLLLTVMLAGCNPPVATQAGISARSGTSSSPVTPFVSDPDFPEVFTFQILSAPANGTAALVNNRLVYTPTITSGLDSFAYRATDRTGKFIDGTALVRIYENSAAGSVTGLGRCTTASTVNANGTLGLRINGGPCAFYGEAVTRVTSTGTSAIVRYVVHRPSSGVPPKAVVILIAGGNLNANFTGGDALTGAITTTGGNFLVRTAQLVAEAGYVAVVIDRPSDREGLPAAVDAYRISVDHAVDILAVARLVNTDNLPLILAGTSRGAMSVLANNLIASRIEMSSAVTSGFGLYVGVPGTPTLQPSFVQRPVHVLWHENDLCPISTPANSQNLFSTFQTQLGNNATSFVASGGLRVTAPSANVMPDICGAFDFHGFLGIEPSVIATESGFRDAFLSALPINKQPEAAFVTVSTASAVALPVNLLTLTHDADNDPLSYALAHTTTSLGGGVALNGTVVTYTPPAGVSNQTDYFVYVVTDSKGGVRAAVVTVNIGS